VSRRARPTSSSIVPRLFTREQAAAYCSLSVEGFSEWVKLGRLPGPIVGTQRWDLRAIDSALDLVSGIRAGEPPSPLDVWRRERAGSSQRNSQGQ
jgi:hypothetical protein